MRGLTHIRAHRHDPLTRFGNHDQLIDDLARALEPGSPPAVLAVFELLGSSAYRNAYGQRTHAALIRRCAERFAHVLQGAGVCYRPRQDELCVLIDGPIGEVIETLTAAEHALEDREGPAPVSARFGVALLPDEADDPIELLVLADQRLGIRTGGREPRDVANEPSPSIQPTL
jgi:GGDEF domain-containing protein